MFNQIVLFLQSGKDVFYTFSSVVLVFIVILLIKNFISKKTINTLHKHTLLISQLQQDLWLQKKKAYYDIKKETIVDEKGAPVSLSNYKDVINLDSFIGNEFPTLGIRIGINGFAPQKQYFLNKKLNILLQPIAGTDVWKVESNITDRTILTHPIMGELVLDGISSKIKDQKEVKIYQRVTYIGKDCLVQYELRED